MIRPLYTKEVTFIVYFLIETSFKYIPKNNFSFSLRKKAVHLMVQICMCIQLYMLLMVISNSVWSLDSSAVRPRLFLDSPQNNVKLVEVKI